MERAEGGPNVVWPARGVNAPEPMMALAEGPVGLESNVYVDAERSSSGSMSGSETKENRGLPLNVLGEEGANEDGKGCSCLKDGWGAVLGMVSGVPSWIVLLGKMKESRDCDGEAINVPRQSVCRLSYGVAKQSGTRTFGGRLGWTLGGVGSQRRRGRNM